MIGIMGLPRAGTTFLTELIFTEIKNFNPALFTFFETIGESVNQDYNLNEPQIVSAAMRKGVPVTPALKMVESYYEDAKGEIVLKLPQLCTESADVLDHNFDKIILCFRRWEGWEKSAVEHGVEGYLNVRPAWLPESVKNVKEIYGFLHVHTKYLLNRLPEKTVRYDFGNDESLIRVLKYIGYTGNKTKHSDFENWRGSRHEK